MYNIGGKNMEPIEKVMLAANALDDKKGRRIKALEVRELTSISDYFVIASGGSASQVQALADNVEEKLAEQGISPLHTEGYNAGAWILLDYGDVVVHIFSDEMREFYDIERLWTDAIDVELEIDNA